MYRGNDYSNFVTSNDLENLVKNASIKYGRQLWELFDGKDPEWAMQILCNQEVVDEASEKYVTAPAIVLMQAFLDKNVPIKSWSIDMYQKPTAKKHSEFHLSGKFRIKLVIETGGYFGKKRDLAIYLYGSADRSMRNAIFTGFLERLCLNGVFVGEIIGEFIRQKHIHCTLEELLKRISDTAQAVVEYINSHEVEKMAKFMERMDTEVVSPEVETQLARKVLEKRVQMALTDKFFENGGKIEIQQESVVDFVNQLKEKSRVGHEGETFNQFFQRLQEGIGANPKSADRKNFMPKGIKYLKHVQTDDGNETTSHSMHQMQLNDSKTDKKIELNLFTMEVFKQELEQTVAMAA